MRREIFPADVTLNEGPVTECLKGKTVVLTLFVEQEIRRPRGQEGSFVFS